MLSIGSMRGGTGTNSGIAEIPTTSPDAPVLQECGYFDVEQVGKIAQALLVSLGTACVEKTAGDPFNHPGAVVADVKKEMLEYLNVQSEAFATGTSAVVLQISGEIPSPLQVVGDILEAFVGSKKNLFSRVSSKLLYSEKKEEKIDDFVQELDRTGAWMIGRREVLARALLKRVDRGKMFHCELQFDTSEQLAEHKGKCALRPVTCENEGCGAIFSAFNAKPHDGNCPFKQLPCEQGCKVMVKRGDMDKHCVTLCPMKLVNCPFAQAGCTQSLPQGIAEQHCVDNMGQHLLLVFQTMQKQGVSLQNQGQRINLLEKAMQISQRSEAVDIGTVLLTSREQEIRLKTMEQEMLKLRQDQKATDVSGEVLQLRRELRNLQKSLETLSAQSAPQQQQ
ncbi:hypothetical protein R1flu_023184 [Riccia fluitans]|uniref:TRAF-type domain-containing protein n=1 Tax=Riccia fluitans TaxID=41844 RepID=A0ABD1XRB4_9MARC